MCLQLEFSLLAVHDDPLPRLQDQIAQLQAAGRQVEASELVVRVANENAKRENWAVSRIVVPHYIPKAYSTRTTVRK